MQTDRMDWKLGPAKLRGTYITTDVQNDLSGIIGRSLEPNVVEEIEWRCRSYVALENSLKKPAPSKQKERIRSIEKSSARLLRALGGEEPLGALHLVGIPVDLEKLFYDLLILHYSMQRDLIEKKVPHVGENGHPNKRNEVILVGYLSDIFDKYIDDIPRLTKPKWQFIQVILRALGQELSYHMIRERFRTAKALNYLGSYDTERVITSQASPSDRT